MCSAIGLCACGEEEAKETTKSTSENNTSEKETTENTTQETTTEEADDKVTYTIKVVDEDGNAIAGAMVQLCKDSCVPGKTDDNGVAEFKLAEDDYKASLMAMPEGYEYSGEEEAFYYEDGATELTITLKKKS